MAAYTGGKLTVPEVGYEPDAGEWVFELNDEGGRLSVTTRFEVGPDVVIPQTPAERDAVRALLLSDYYQSRARCRDG